MTRRTNLMAFQKWKEATGKSWADASAEEKKSFGGEERKEPTPVRYSRPGDEDDEPTAAEAPDYKRAPTYVRPKHLINLRLPYTSSWFTDVLGFNQVGGPGERSASTGAAANFSAVDDFAKEVPLGYLQLGKNITWTTVLALLPFITYYYHRIRSLQNCECKFRVEVKRVRRQFFGRNIFGIT